MLARRLTTILPAMTLVEAIETTPIHRVVRQTVYLPSAREAVLHSNETRALLCDGSRGPAGRVPAVETVREETCLKGWLSAWHPVRA
jgi:hypothetical protein